MLHGYFFFWSPIITDVHIDRFICMRVLCLIAMSDQLANEVEQFADNRDVSADEYARLIDAVEVIRKHQ